MKKKILFVTCTRADYGKLKSLIINIQKNNIFISKVFVSGMHNMKRYGSTYEEIVNDRVVIAKTIGKAIFIIINYPKLK